MPIVFVLNSPLQYLLANIIARHYFGGRSCTFIQYTDNGDYKSAFREVDKLVAPADGVHWITYRGRKSIAAVRCERLFFSNRFNPSEIEIFLSLKGRTEAVCAFEDGVSIYLGHNFRDPSWNDSNSALRLRNLYHSALWHLGRRRRPLFFPFSAFDEVYTLFPFVPGMRQGAKWFALAEPFRDALKGPGGTASNACVLLSQSLVTDQLVEEQAYCEFLQRRVQELRGRYQRLYFKPHPRDPASVTERLARLGCEALPDPYAATPVEIFLARHPGTDIAGFWSSTLMYASLVDATPFSFGKLLMQEIEPSPALRAAWSSNERLLERFRVRDYIGGAQH